MGPRVGPQKQCFASKFPSGIPLAPQTAPERSREGHKPIFMDLSPIFDQCVSFESTFDRSGHSNGTTLIKTTIKTSTALPETNWRELRPKSDWKDNGSADWGKIAGVPSSGKMAGASSQELLGKNGRASFQELLDNKNRQQHPQQQ